MIFLGLIVDLSLARKYSGSNQGRCSHCWHQRGCNLFTGPEHHLLPQELYREPERQQAGPLRFSDRFCAGGRGGQFAQHETALCSGANLPSPDGTASKTVLIEVPGHMRPLGEHEPQSLPPNGRGETHHSTLCKVSIVIERHRTGIDLLLISQVNGLLLFCRRIGYNIKEIVLES
jgi:hypothetical protein